MTEELYNLKNYLKSCLRTKSYHLPKIDNNAQNNQLAIIARDYLMERHQFKVHNVYVVWFAMRELIINKFTFDPSYYDVLQTVLHNCREFVKIDPDTEFDWNNYRDKYCLVKRCIVYSLKNIDCIINLVCNTAKELRKKYIDDDIHVNFDDIEKLYINSNLFCKKIHNEYTRVLRVINYNDEIVKTYKYLKNWCTDNSFDFKGHLSKNLNRIDLLDIIGRVVDDVGTKYDYYYKTIDFVHIVWYAFKMWTTLDDDKDYHELDEIKQLLNEHKVLLNDFQMDEDDVMYYIQYSEKLLNKYINKFNRDIVRVDISNLPFKLYRKRNSDYIQNYDKIYRYKNVLIKYINLLSMDKHVVCSSTEINELEKGLKVLKDFINTQKLNIKYEDLSDNTADDNFYCSSDSSD